ncbi:MAG: GNAT family N-acetyltransferase [Candidatus Saccharicenans sp.]|uniref:GNAT family N-acetyltransferase n=1 Tax=Candidatus Saccharicenans sp. TaxID=2819258 RepID=UPI00404963B9
MVGKVSIRKLSGKDEFARLIDIQRVVWKHPDLDLTPVHQFCISTFMGGLVLGAFVEDKLAGFVYSFPAIYKGRFCHHSHLLAVLPQFQGYGLGKKLKWAQRREVLKLGLDLITWTYDPMQSRNANLNFHTLGVICRNYLPDFYGETPQLCLGPGIPTDRLLVEWPIKSTRVQKKAEENEEKSLDLSFLPKALEGYRAEDGSYQPKKPNLKLIAPVFLAETVREVRALQSTPGIIASWQAALRQVLTHYFKNGYAIVDFIFGEQCYYLLKRMSAGKLD